MFQQSRNRKHRQQQNNRHNNRQKNQRRGMAAVEFAIILPVILTLLLGIIEIGRAYEVAYIMSTAVREGARFGSMDKEGIVVGNQTSNEKIIQDIRNYMAASGLPTGNITISITTVPANESDPGDPFDLDDPDNDLELYQISAVIAYSEVSYLPANFLKNKSLSSKVVFRNSRATIVN